MVDNVPLLSPTIVASSLPKFVGNTKEECIKSASNVLSKLGYFPVTMSLKTDVTNASAHQQLRKGNDRKGTQKFYCGRCTTFNMNSWNKFGKRFQCCVIATFNIHQEGSAYTLYLRTLYPHAKECQNYVIENHRRSFLRLSDHGRGYYKFSIDFQTVVGNVFEHILHKMQNVTQSQLGLYHSQHGKKITSGFIDGNTPELRWYILLQSDKGNKDDTQKQIDAYYDLNSELFQQQLNHLMTRISIVISNELNIAPELNFEKFQDPSNEQPPQSHLHPHTTPQHLWVTNPSIIFGGYDAPTTAETVHQIPHTDYASVNGVDLAHSDQFQHDWKPSSIIVPLVDYRKMVIYKEVHGIITERIETIRCGDMFIFEGDVVYGGASYSASIPNLHPALHLYLYSKKHPSDLNTFTISTHHCLRQDQFTPFLHQIITPDSTEEELETYCTGLERAVEKIRLSGNMDENKLHRRIKQLKDRLSRTMKRKLRH